MQPNNAHNEKNDDSHENTDDRSKYHEITGAVCIEKHTITYKMRPRPCILVTDFTFSSPFSCWENSDLFSFSSIPVSLTDFTAFNIGAIAGFT